MLEVRNISKTYVTGELTQVALDNVSLTLRDNEFVAILGPSGSGKTTLLNVIGGLDRYDSGDLVIDGVSTKEYKDKDWTPTATTRSVSCSRTTISSRTRASSATWNSL